MATGVVPLPLQGQVPVLHLAAIEPDFLRSRAKFEAQLRDWGFMALELPGIGERVAAVQAAFSAACRSVSPHLTEFHYASVPQLSTGGNHGFFPYGAEVPRLAAGVADPKEFVHVSGAMLEDLPPGSADVLRAFPALDVTARALFDIGFKLALLFGELLRRLISEAAPDLGLSRHSSILRILHYRDVKDTEVLAHEHSGIQMLGIQFPPSDRGLQYVLHDGQWTEPVLASTDVVLCNIGAMLSSASGGRFRPSTHRVHRLPSPNYERWSTVLFVHPDHQQSQWRVNKEGEVKRSDETWGDFVANNIRDLGLKPDLTD
jgi:hypothetical protein